MRVPLAVTLESRDGTVDQDAICRNTLVEVKGEQASLRKRPGIEDLGLVKAGVAQLLTYWDDSAIAIQDDYINRGSFLTSLTWNSADKGAQITLSNGDLTVATTVAQNTSDGVRANFNKSAGSWYFEFTLPSSGVGATANISVGVADSTWGVTSDALGATTKSISYRMDGAIRYNGSTIDAADAWANSDVIGVAFIVGTSVSFYLNNVLQYTSTSIPVGAAWYPAAGGQGAGAAGSGTANFGATAFTYSAPSGYSGAGADPETIGPITSTALSVSTADLPFSAQDNGRNAPKSYLMFKNAEKAFTLDQDGTIAAITDTDYPGTYAVTLTSLTQTGGTATATTAVDTNFQVGSSVTIAGATPADYNGAKTLLTVTPSVSTEGRSVAIRITRSGTTATATTVSEPHGFTNGQSVTIAGAGQDAYNGVQTITWISATSFSYTVTVTNDVTTPATGSPVITEYVAINAANTAGALETWTATYTATMDGHVTMANGDTFAFSAPSYYTGTAPPAATYTVASASSTGFTFQVVGATATGMFSYTTVRRVTGGAAVSSITSLNGVATVTTSAAHGYPNGFRQLAISGCTQPQYNLQVDAIIVTSTTTFTYALPASVNPTTPATGAITAQVNSTSGAAFTYAIGSGVSGTAAGTLTATGGRNTVPGIAYVDGYFAVMDVNGVIYNSAEDDPTNWETLEYTIAQAESGAGKHLTRSLNFLVAFKEWSTELFFNAANEPPGSPFSPVENGFTQIGCASGDSIAHLDGQIYWLAQARQKGRSVYRGIGTQQEKISTPDVERILNADDLATVHAYGLKLDGHSLYVLTLVTSDLTLVFDGGAWTQWTSLTLGASKSVSTITRSGTTATVTTGTAHGLSDGDPVKISGATQSEYNGIFQISYVSTTVFTIEVTGSPATPATGTILAYPYTETYFKFSKAANLNGIDGLLHESDGHLYKLLSTVYQDAEIPINAFARTARMDGGSIGRKKMSRVYVIGDKVSDTLMIRYSDDDSTTFSAYRRVDLSTSTPDIRRLGAFERRSMEIRHIGNTALNLSALELEVGQ